MAKGDAVPEVDEVTRWIKPKLLGKDDDGNVAVDAGGRPTDVFPQAFTLREDEEGLSVTWLQSFGLVREEQIRSAAEAVRESVTSKSLKPLSAFAIGNVGDILRAGRKHKAKLRVVHEPEPENLGHSEIRRLPHEFGSLHAELAHDVFRERYLYKDIRAPE